MNDDVYAPPRPPAPSPLNRHKAQVSNQAVPLEDYNAFDSDPALQEALDRHAAGWAVADARKVGAIAGSGWFGDLARQANRNGPVLRTHDRYGRRVSQVEFHPAYHTVMETGIANEVASYAWTNAERPGAHVARSSLGYMLYQAEAGTQCPMTMTFACVPALRRHMTEAQRSRCAWDAKAKMPMSVLRNR